MKSIKNIKLLMVVGLLLQVGIGFADDPWERTGPTKEDIMAATRVENRAAKGSREDKLINAAKNGDHKNIATLIAAGVGLEARDNQDRTALMRAAEKGYSDVVRILLDAGADVRTKDKFGWTAFFMAADKNHVEVVKMLIARGAASDKNFKDVFVSSVFKGNIEMVKALAGEGANISCDIINTAYSIIDWRNTELVTIMEQLKSQCNSSKIVD